MRLSLKYRPTSSFPFGPNSTKTTTEILVLQARNSTVIDEKDLLAQEIISLCIAFSHYMEKKLGATITFSIAKGPGKFTIRNNDTCDLVTCSFSYPKEAEPSEISAIKKNKAFWETTRYPTENHDECVRMLQEVTASLEAACRESPHP